MNKEQIKEKILLQKNARLVDILEINNSCYAKTLAISKNPTTNIMFKYYKISNEDIEDIKNEELDKVRNLFENDLGNIVY